MLVHNSGDLRKARSNHWFFSYLPESISVRLLQSNGSRAGIQAQAPRVLYQDADDEDHAFWRRYGYYIGFILASLLALYTQIAIVHPTQIKWQQTSLEAFSWEHRMAQNDHERLARKFHAEAQFHTIDGFRARAHAAKAAHESQVDMENATVMYLRAKKEYQEVQEEKHDAEVYGEMAASEHELYVEYLANASAAEERAKELEDQAYHLGREGIEDQRFFIHFLRAARDDEEMEDKYFKNATQEGDLADNITNAEQAHEQSLWVCHHMAWFCRSFGGMTALAEADELRDEQAKDYRKAMGYQNRAMIEKTEAMIALTRAAQLETAARVVHLRAGLSHNISLEDEVKAEQEHEIELQNLQKELEDMKLGHAHLNEVEHDQKLQVDLKTRARKEREYAHGQWELSNELLEEAETEQEQAEGETKQAQREAQKQDELIAQASTLGRTLLLYASFAAAYSLVAISFFFGALLTSNSVCLGYQLKMMVNAFAVTFERRWESTSWEGRSILGNNQNRNCLRQLSCWYHHILFFLVAAAMQGEQLNSIFEYESLHMRGEILMRFALNAGILETLLFQASCSKTNFFSSCLFGLSSPSLP